MLQRDSQTFNVAVRVIEAAMDLAHRARWHEADREDGEGWMADGAALRAMLGGDEATQAASLTALAAACQRVVAAQPMLVRVAAPVKLFGDVHTHSLKVAVVVAAYPATFGASGTASEGLEIRSPHSGREAQRLRCPREAAALARGRARDAGPVDAGPVLTIITRIITR